MKYYKTKIRFITEYLQARFSEDAKAELENYMSKGIVKTPEEAYKTFLFQDATGIYIPALQIRNSLKNAGKEFKEKKKRSSMKQWVISNIVIQPSNIYIGKTEPDDVITSFPLRKDGTRVVAKHPSFNIGLEVEFFIKILDDDMEDIAIEKLVKEAGKTYGIGARRVDMYGRFELVEFNSVKSI